MILDNSFLYFPGNYKRRNRNVTKQKYKKTIGQENHGHVLLIAYERARKLANFISLRKT